VRFPWPEGFERVPGEDWTRAPIEQLALKYDTVREHGWYRNLDRTVRDLGRFLEAGHILLDYSGGTGILTERLLEELEERGFGVVIVDASPKFLRLALEKLGRHERVAFRLIRYRKEEKRLQLVEEVLGRGLVDRGVDAISSTNAIHLYYDLEETVASWARVLRPGGRVFVQSGNIGLGPLPPHSWIIDETVEAIHRAAMDLVRTDARWSSYRAVLDDDVRMASYDELRRKFFLPVRPIAHYLARLERAGLHVLDVAHVPIEAHVDQWYEFLATYHEGVLGWAGGSARVSGKEPAESEIADRLALLRDGMERVFGPRTSFQAVWTYIVAEVPRA
jgi:ubiquinone/menaquinone biosynthesis C-methylase UbiE